MKEVKLTIKIDRSAEDVFAFAINPENTSKWIDEIVHEVTSEWPVKLGSIYKNQNQQGDWSEYVVTEFEPSKTFTFSQKGTGYHVRYTLTQTSETSCELEYYECVDKGELSDPFTQDVLQKLKDVIETT